MYKQLYKCFRSCKLAGNFTYIKQKMTLIFFPQLHKYFKIHFLRILPITIVRKKIRMKPTKLANRLRCNDNKYINLNTPKSRQDTKENSELKHIKARKGVKMREVNIERRGQRYSPS